MLKKLYQHTTRNNLNHILGKCNNFLTNTFLNNYFISSKFKKYYKLVTFKIHNVQLLHYYSSLRYFLFIKFMIYNRKIFQSNPKSIPKKQPQAAYIFLKNLKMQYIYYYCILCNIFCKNFVLL